MFKKVWALLTGSPESVSREVPPPTLTPEQIEKKYASEVNPAEMKEMEERAFAGLRKPEVPVTAAPEVPVEVPEIRKDSDREQAA